MKKTICFIIFLLVLGIVPVAGAEQASLSVLIKEALEKNPEVEAAKAMYEAALTRAPQMRSFDDPMLDLKAGQVATEDQNFGKGKSYSVGFSQLLPFPGKLKAKGEIAEKEALAAKAMYEAKKRDVVAAVKKAYYELYMVERAIDINRQNKELVNNFVKIAETRYSVGKVSQQDVLKGLVELSKLANELITLGQQKETAQAKLAILLNRDVRSQIEIPSEFEEMKFSKTLDELIELSKENRPEIKSAESMIESSQAKLSLAKKNYLPDFKLGFDYTRMNMPMPMEKNLLAGMVGMNIPWIFKGKYDYAVKEAQAEIKKAEADKKAVENITLFEVKDSLVKVESGQRLVSVYRTSIIPQAKQSLESSIISYQTDRIDFLSLIDSQRALKDFQLEYYKSLVDFETALADLERAVGRDI